jgi:hypothetical protein
MRLRNLLLTATLQHLEPKHMGNANFAVILAVLVCCVCLQAAAVPATTTHYSADVNIDPAAQTLGAKVRLDFRAPADGMKTLTFYLHRQLVISSMKSPDVKSWRVLNERPTLLGFGDSAPVQIELTRALNQGEAITLDFTYSGKVTQHTWPVNRISADLVEMGLYMPWFPLNMAYGEFTSEVNLTIPREYQVAGYGEISGGKGKWRIVRSTPTTDIVIMAARNFVRKTSRKGGYEIEVTYPEGEYEGARQALRYGIDALTTYASWFGDAGEKRVQVFISPREQGGGFARRGLVVLSDMRKADDPASLCRYLGHEIGHLWWAGAPVNSYEDWMNESFAEYSALMLVRDKISHAAYDIRVQQNMAKSAGAPPVFGLDRNDKAAQTVLYSKGPLILKRLEDQIGPTEFRDLLRRTYSDHVHSTSAFLALVSTMNGPKQSATVDGWMRE